ncbi:hypothetical protein J2S78_001810 [Salibacterium salarium]|uniref:Uncharacterized protein n=1 Tax=Salibacterium salarium TaxID=284579 RepID=A0A428N693_9BACI|nr:hypothetical protein [Salibacterium salarium]MDQ0299390.1 hypothetical protein [Salibacterium salarium]RSL33767.1 hypothetical protein D7Z54_08730 [Salibacterium salarium]
MRNRLTMLLLAFALFIVPSNAYASVNAWNDAEPAFITGLTILSVITLILFIYLMIRDNG